MPAIMRRERRHVGQVVGVDEHAAWSGGDARSGASRRRRAASVDVEEAGDGLLLEPLARVARVDAGGVGQLAGGDRAVALDRAVEAEPRAEVHGEELQRAQRGAEQALDEGVAAVGGGVYGHGQISLEGTAARPARLPGGRSIV